MTERQKDRFSPPPVGGSSLLTVFALLALTVFALLSLATVRSDVRLADASAQTAEDYYAADCKAQEILARLRNGERPEGVEFSGSGMLYADYAVPISDSQELRVTVSLSGSGSYRVLCWRAVSVGEWDPDNTLDLWDGESF